MSGEIDSHVQEKYDVRKRLGKGAYGIVWKAIDRRSGQIVALKKIFDAFRNKTDAQRTFREIMFLHEFNRHPNIIKLQNIIRASNDKDIYLTFEYMDTDLHNVIKKGNILKDIHKQYIMYQLFRAVKYLHSGNVIHRDLKPSNVLLDVNCTMKLADFGLARSMGQAESEDPQQMPELTEYVATRWYRAPEILLSAKRYTKGVDMWSLGCILGEMWLGKALFPGTSTMNQVEKIMSIITAPSHDEIRRIGSVYAESVLGKVPQNQTGSLKELLLGSPRDSIDMVERLLLFSPDRRLDIDDCINHPYVAQFHACSDEPVLDYDVHLCFPDDVQLSVSEYRNKLYEIIANRKANIRRVYHNPSAANRRRSVTPPTTPQAPMAQSEALSEAENANLVAVVDSHLTPVAEVAVSKEYSRAAQKARRHSSEVTQNTNSIDQPSQERSSKRQTWTANVARKLFNRNTSPATVNHHKNSAPSLLDQ